MFLSGPPRSDMSRDHQGLYRHEDPGGYRDPARVPNFERLSLLVVFSREPLVTTDTTITKLIRWLAQALSCPPSTLRAVTHERVAVDSVRLILDVLGPSAFERLVEFGNLLERGSRCRDPQETFISVSMDIFEANPVIIRGGYRDSVHSRAATSQHSVLPIESADVIIHPRSPSARDSHQFIIQRTPPTVILPEQHSRNALRIECVPVHAVIEGRSMSLNMVSSVGAWRSCGGRADNRLTMSQSRISCTSGVQRTGVGIQCTIDRPQAESEPTETPINILPPQHLPKDEILISRAGTPKEPVRSVSSDETGSDSTGSEVASPWVVRRQAQNIWDDDL
jgi:hypothetical protein